MVFPASIVPFIHQRERLSALLDDPRIEGIFASLLGDDFMHSSWGGENRRRMFTINVCQRYKEADLDQLKDYIAGHARFWIDRNYGEIMMNTAGPERIRHLEQVMANDGHLAALSAKARLEMSEPARG
jgi:hypothetical protein